MSSLSGSITKLNRLFAKVKQNKIEIKLVLRLTRLKGTVTRLQLSQGQRLKKQLLLRDQQAFLSFLTIIWILLMKR